MCSTKGNETFWTEFLHLYKSLPVLWDENCPNFCYRQAKYDAYDIMVDKLKELNPNADRGAVKHKLKYFRARFKLECSRVNTSLQEGGHYQCSWRYFDLLRFLGTGSTKRVRIRERINIVTYDDKDEKSVMPECVTLDDCLKAIRLYKKVDSSKTSAELFGIISLRGLFRSRYVLNHCKENPSTLEPQIGDIIIPSVQLKISPDCKQLMSAVIIRKLELLAECVCEALKRDQVFTENAKRRRTNEFAAIISDDKVFERSVWLTRFDYKLRFASEETSQRYEVLPVPVDLHEIFCYCLKKFVTKNKETESSENNNNLAKTQYLTPDFEHLEDPSYSKVIQLLHPITDFAILCVNRNGLKSIDDLKQHISCIKSFKYNPQF